METPWYPIIGVLLGLAAFWGLNKLTRGDHRNLSIIIGVLVTIIFLGVLMRFMALA